MRETFVLVGATLLDRAVSFRQPSVFGAGVTLVTAEDCYNKSKDKGVLANSHLRVKKL